MDDNAIRAAFPKSPQLFEAKPSPVDPAVRAAFPASEEMFTEGGSAQGGQVAQWEDAVRAEHGANLGQTLADARSVINQFGDTELKDALDDSGLGSHPAIVRFVAKVAAAMKKGR
jgi:hypothetical protein